MGAAEVARGASNTAGDGSRTVSQSSLSCNYPRHHQRTCILLLLVLCECPIRPRHNANHQCRPWSQFPRSTYSLNLRTMPLGHLHNRLCRMLLNQCHNHNTLDLQWQCYHIPFQILQIPHSCPLHTLSLLQLVRRLLEPLQLQTRHLQIPLCRHRYRKRRLPACQYHQRTWRGLNLHSGSQ